MEYQIDPEKKKQLDANIKQMEKNGVSEADITKYAADFNAKYSGGDTAKKQSPPAGGLSPSASPSRQVPQSTSSATATPKGTPASASSSGEKPKFRLPNEGDYKEMQRRGLVPPSSALPRPKVETDNLYDLPANNATVKKKKSPTGNVGLEALDKYKQPKFKSEEEAKAYTASAGGQDDLYNFTAKDKDVIKKEIDLEIEDNDLDLDHPYLYYSSYSKDTERPVPTNDDFVSKQFGDDKLEAMGINPADFDGFINKRGYKKDFLDKQDKGLFEGDGRNWQGGDIQLAYEREKQRMLTLYIEDANKRQYSRDALTAEKDNLDKNYNDRTVVKPTTKFDYNKVQEYIDTEMPVLAKKLKERDASNKEILEAHKNGEAGFWYGAEKTLKAGFNGLRDRVNNLASTGADLLGMDAVADNIRMTHEERLLERPDTREVSFVQGKAASYKGGSYIVDEDGQIYDSEKKIRVTDLFDQKEYDAVVAASKAGQEESLFSPQGAAIQTGKVIGDMVVQVAATRGLGAIGGTSKALSSIPMSRNLGSAIAAQSAMGYSSGLEDTLKAAKDAGLNDTDAEALASDAAKRMAVLYAVTAPISPQTKATEALFGGGTKNLIKKAVTAFKEGGKRKYLDVVRNGISKLAAGAAEFTEEGLKEVFQETVQQVGENTVINAATNRAAGQDIVKDTFTGTDFVNTAILAFTASGLTSQMRTPNLFRADATERLRGLQKLAYSPDTDNVLKQMVYSGTVTQDEANKLNSDIEVFKRQSNTLPKNLSPEVALPVMKDLQQISDLTTQKKTLDKAFHEGIDAQIETIRGRIQGSIQFSTLPRAEQKQYMAQAQDNGAVSPDNVLNKAIKLYTDAKAEPSTEGAKTETTPSEGKGSNSQTVQTENAISNEQNKTETRPGIREQSPEGGQGSIEAGADRRLQPDAGTLETGQSESSQSEPQVDFTVQEERYDNHHDITIKGQNSVGENISSIVLSQTKDGTYDVSWSIVNDKQNRGKGYGKATYLKAVDEIRKRGITVFSDRGGITEDAQRVWESLVKDGQAVKVGDVKGNPEFTERESFPVYRVLPEKSYSIEVVDSPSRMGDAYGKVAKEAKLSYYSASARKLNVQGIKARLTEAVKAGKLSTGKSTQLINAALSLNIDNEESVDKFFNRFAKAMVLAEKNVQIEKLKADRARVKRAVKTKLNRELGDAARKLVAIKMDNVPEDVFEDYANVVGMLAKGQGIDRDKVNEVWEQVAEAYQQQVDERYAEKMSATKDKPDTLKEQVLLSDAIDTATAAPEDATDYEKAILYRFRQIPKAWLMENLSKKDMASATKALYALSEGVFQNKTLNTITARYAAQKASNSILSQAGKYVGFVNGWNGKFASLFSKKKNFTTQEFQDAMAKSMLQHIDTVVNGIKGTVIYDEIIHPITANLNKSNVQEDAIEKEHSHLLAAARASREGGRGQRFLSSVSQALNMREGNYYFEFDVLRQLYYRAKEFQANPELKGTKVNTVEKHIEAMMDNRNSNSLSNIEKEVIFQLYDKLPKLPDGDIDTEATYNSFTEAERRVIAFEEDTIRDMEDLSREVNDHRKGESLQYIKAYFPRKNDGATFVDDFDVAKNLSGFLGSTSVKATASNSRVDGVRPLDFKTSRHFMTHVREGLIEYNLSDVVKRSGMTVSNLKASDNDGIVKMASALEGSIKTLLEAQFRTNPYSPKSKAGQLWRATVKNTANKMLIDPLRAIVDGVGNWGTFYTAYADRIPEMRRAAKTLSNDFMTETLLQDFGSTQAERLFGSHEVDYRTGITSSTGKAKFAKYKPTVLENFIDLYSKNKFTDFAVEAAKLQYALTDKPAGMLWKLEFTKAFNQNAGQDFDMEAYSSNPEYKLQHEGDIKAAITKADKTTSNLFNTSTRAEQKLAIQASNNWWTRSFDSFMKSFSFNENKVFWDSLYSMFGNGTMSKEDAIRAFFIVNTRSIAYSYAMQTVVSYVLAMTGFDDDEELYKKAFQRSLASHAMLVGLGNKGTLWNIAAGLVFEGIRAEVMEADGKKYDPYEDSLLYVPPQKGKAVQYVGMLGAEGSALQALYKTGDLGMKITEKVYNGDKITEEELIEWKAAQISASFISQTTGLPIDRTGKLAQKALESRKKTAAPQLQDTHIGTIFK